MSEELPLSWGKLEIQMEMSNSTRGGWSVRGLKMYPDKEE